MRFLFAIYLIFQINSVVMAQYSAPSLSTKQNTLIDGVSLSARLISNQYSYKEPGVMKISGSLSGIGLDGSVTTSTDMTMKGELEYLSGKPKYVGSLSSGEPATHPSKDYVYEVRALIGKTAIPVGESVTFEWFSGFGHRYLNDQGQSKYAYEREQTYNYIPVIGAFNFFPGAGINVNTYLELDLFMGGRNTSHLNDVSSSFPKLKFKQDSGSGTRLGVKGSKQFGNIVAFLKLEVSSWEIDQSSVAYAYIGGDLKTFVEPHNETEITSISAGVSF